MPLVARLAIALCSVSFALVAPTTCWAQSESDDDRAKQLYQNGADLYNEGRYEEAITAWQEAYRLSKRAKILFNIANAYERMGELQDALDTLFQYKIYATSDQREQIERRIRMLETRIAETPEPKPDPVPNPNPDPQPQPQPKPKPVRTGSGPSAGGLALLGGGVVALGAGGALGLVSSSAKKSALEGCVEGPDTLYCSADAGADLNRHRTTAILADVGFAVGAIAAGTGVVLLATSGGKAQMGVGPNRVWINGRF